MWKGRALKVYFDNVIVSAAVMLDQAPDEMAAVEKLVAAFAEGKIDARS
jgi:hypothetical protein